MRAASSARSPSAIDSSAASPMPFSSAIAPTSSLTRKHAFVMNPGSPPECWSHTVSPRRTPYQPMHHASVHASLPT